MKKNTNRFSTFKITLLVFFLALSWSVTAQSWEELNAPPFYKHHSNGFGYNGKAYVLEGVFNNDGPNFVSNEVWEYTPETDSWTQLPDFPGEPRAIAIGDFWNDKYYYGFGAGANGRLNDLWVFDPVDTSFTELPSCPCQGRSHPALIAHNDKIFMGTGSTENGDLNDWWVYDMITQEWEQKPNVPGGVRHHPFFFGIGDYVYVGGGHRSNWLRFDPATDEWEAIDNAPLGRVAGTQFNYDGKGYALAGDDAQHNDLPMGETFMQYDPATDEWVYLPELPNGSRWAPSSFIIDNMLYFFGGLSSAVIGDQSMWQFNLDYVSCQPPNGLSAIDVEANTAGLFWLENSGGADTLKWRKQGEETWNIVLDPQAVYTLTGLETCEDYEFLLTSSCGELSTTSELLTFRTEGCCTNPVVVVEETTAVSADLTWPGTGDVSEYEVRFRVAGSAEWQMVTTGGTAVSLDGLLECTQYECAVKAVCGNPDAPFGTPFVFYTKGCGGCTEAEYCALALAIDEAAGYISKVQINDYINESGSGAGFAGFTLSDVEEMVPGTSFELRLQSMGSAAMHWNVWIDFDANGVFDTGEMVVDEASSAGEISRDIAIPTSAALGFTRMRVVYGMNAPNAPCDDAGVNVGEAEDYCINIVSATNTSNLDAQAWSVVVYPNPVQNAVRLTGNLPVDKPYQLRILDAAGMTVRVIEDAYIEEPIDASFLAAGVYFLTLRNEAVVKTVKFVKQD